MDSVVQQDRVNMSQAEWQARCDLAALYQARLRVVEERSIFDGHLQATAATA